MPKGSRRGELWFASIALWFGGIRLIEGAYKFSLMSALLGVGIVLWLLWISDQIYAHRKRGPKPDDHTEESG